MRTSKTLYGLYAITPDWADTARLLAATRAVLAGGCRLVQYRNKAASPALRLEQARALRALTAEYAACLIVNDDLDLALEIGADGVHLGMHDGDLATARAALGPTALLGASCYQSLTRAQAAVMAGADYVAFGSVFPSPTKPQAARVELGRLSEAVRSLPVPVAAIGGITLANADLLIKAGVQLLAVISALFEATDPAAASQRFVQRLAATMADVS